MKEPKTTATRQFAYLALVRVNEDDLDALRTRLKEIDVQTTAVMWGRTPKQVHLPFQNLITVHYARFVVIDNKRNGGPPYTFTLRKFDLVDVKRNISPIGRWIITDIEEQA